MSALAKAIEMKIIDDATSLRLISRAYRVAPPVQETSRDQARESGTSEAYFISKGCPCGSSKPFELSFFWNSWVGHLGSRHVVTDHVQHRKTRVFSFHVYTVLLICIKNASLASD